jgi:hypothetical protein
MFDRYSIVSEGDLREAAWKLAAYNGAVHAERTSGGDSSVTIGNAERSERPVLRSVSRSPAES